MGFPTLEKNEKKNNETQDCLSLMSEIKNKINFHPRLGNKRDSFPTH